jgi:uncharacterized repeat protein (TIGR02543 family)
LRKSRSIIFLILVVLILPFVSLQSALAAQITIAWTAPLTGPTPTGYRVYYGIKSGKYGISINVGNKTKYTLKGLSPKKTYFIAVKAYNKAGSSAYSNELPVVPLTASAKTSGAGTVNPLGTTWYDVSQSQIVSVSATENPGYTFIGWSGDASGTSTPISITMSGPKNVVASFEGVTIPTTPKGVKKGYTGTSYKFLAHSVSNLHHSLEYQFDWGGGSSGVWGPAKQSHYWTSAGSYQVSVQARCATHTNIVSNWSRSASVTINPKPFIHVTSPNGGETCVVGTTHTITWDSGNLDPTGAIYLFYWYAGSWHPITTTPLTTTVVSHNWTIPDTNDPLTKPYVPKSHVRSTSIWIGNWVNGKWECWDSSDKNFKIMDDGWVFTIFGADKGGVTLWFNTDEVSFDGYGISLDSGMFGIQGQYVIDTKGSMNGSYTLYDSYDLTSANPLQSGIFTGKVDLNATKLTLALKASDGKTPVFNMRGVRLLSDPTIPPNVNATISGDVKGTFDTFTITPYQDPGCGGDCAHVFMIYGSESTIPISINGYFFFTPSRNSNGNIVYGIYDQFTIVTTNETGYFSGTLKPNLKKGKFRFKAVSDNGNKYIFKGKVGTP